MSDRKVVRVDPVFFDQLDQQLGEERGPNGQPSSGDFLLVDTYHSLLKRSPHDSTRWPFRFLADPTIGFTSRRECLFLGLWSQAS